MQVFTSTCISLWPGLQFVFVYFGVIVFQVIAGPPMKLKILDFDHSEVCKGIPYCTQWSFTL